MKFTWKAYALAPLITPIIFSATLVSSTASKSPALGFLVTFTIGSLFSYCATAFLFLPCLYLLSKVVPLTARLTCALGAVLGAVIFIPYARLSFQANGLNSGPPQGLFADYLWQQLLEPLNWVLFPAGGLVTAAAYWFFANSSPRSDNRRPE